jgi:dethiobiotin synthetase
MKSCFIAGTDTGVGKTRITVALMTALKQQGLRVMGMKPVATGCVRTPAGLRNADAELIRACCPAQTPYQTVNPYAFEEPVAPLFAAHTDGVRIEKPRIESAFQQLAEQSDVVIVEGVGGWRMRLAADLQLSDIVKSLQLQVILVVGLRLGCINHALLSAEGIRSDGLRLAGWVANQIDPEYSMVDQTLELLSGEMRAPLIGMVPYAVEYDGDETASCLVPRCMEILAGRD